MRYTENGITIADCLVTVTFQIQFIFTGTSNRGHGKGKGKGKAIPLQAWTGPEGSRRLRLPDFKTLGT